jgi:hypothetical protein
VNNLTANCFPSTPQDTQETSTTQGVSPTGHELTTPNYTITPACNVSGQKINLLVVIGLSAIVILQTAGLVYLIRENSLLNSKVKSNYICLENIPPAVPSASSPDGQDIEAEEFNELYVPTQEAGVDYCNTDDCEQQYCEI